MGELVSEDKAMKVHTKTVWDMETSCVVEDQFYHYEGPVALCDRSLTARGKEAQDQAQQAAGRYGGEAAQTYGAVEPTLQSWTQAPPGYGPMGLATMETGALRASAARTGATQEASRLRAMRTGNEAGLGALEASESEGGARAAGSAVEDILARNEMLKQQQRMAGVKGLSGLYGEGMRGDIGAMNVQPEDIKAATGAENVGWLQNAQRIVQMIANPGGRG